jgi:hypothetical protein
MDQTDGTDYIDQIDEIISCLCTNVPLDSSTSPWFPFAVIYLVSGLKMQIVAVAHCKRNPGYWKDRLNEKGRETLGSVFTFLFSNNANFGVKNEDIGLKNTYFWNFNPE